MTAQFSSYGQQLRILPSTRTFAGLDRGRSCLGHTAGETMKLLLDLLATVHKNVSDTLEKVSDDLEDTLATWPMRITHG